MGEDQAGGVRLVSGRVDGSGKVRVAEALGQCPCEGVGLLRIEGVGRIAGWPYRHLGELCFDGSPFAASRWRVEEVERLETF